MGLAADYMYFSQCQYHATINTVWVIRDALQICLDLPYNKTIVHIGLQIFYKADKNLQHYKFMVIL